MVAYLKYTRVHLPGERERVLATCKVALEVNEGRAQYKANYLDN